MHSMPRARFHTLVVLLCTALLLLAAPAALAKPGKAKAHKASAAAVTEDNDTNDGNTPNNLADDGDNRHPSGKDKSVEAGGSGNQGNSTSDPDDDGRGPDRSNGGADKPDGPGGVDLADQDGNNGCGNDDDFEDDNEGWCGANPKRGGPDVEGTDDEPTTPEDESDCAPSHDVNCSGDDTTDETPCGVPTDDCLDGDHGTCDETVNADCTADEDDATVGETGDETEGTTDGDTTDSALDDVTLDEGTLDTVSGDVVLGVFEEADDTVGGVLAAGGGLGAGGLGGAAALGAGALASGTLAATGIPLVLLGALALGGVGLGAGLLRRSKRS